MRLLTEEEIKEFKVKAFRQANDLQQTTEGHFKQEDIDTIYMDRDKAMLEAQRKATLKEVEEFLKDRPAISGALDIYLDFKRIFLRGEMPEEVK